ncbi:aquaporin-like protein [Bisporella sp. PMI_857]|nr:aquaporin-like protein [Bisporella sp. PMI_857]
MAAPLHKDWWISRERRSIILNEIALGVLERHDDAAPLSLATCFDDIDYCIPALATMTSPKDEPSPRVGDFDPESAPYHNHGQGQGQGPSLQDPNDPIQQSDKAYGEHLNKQAKAIPAGPTVKPVASRSPEAHHIEHADDSSQRTVSPQKTLSTLKPRRSTNGSQATVERQETISHLRSKIGLEAEAPILDGHEEHTGLMWSTVRTVFREPFAEFFGTFIMVLFGNGSVAQVLLSTGQTTAPGGDGFGSYQSINWAWALGVMLGIYVAGDSGGFLNPAVTLNFCLFRRLPWRRFPIYFAAQLLGGFVASGVVYANYINPIDQLEGHGMRTVPPSTTATAGIFCTYPRAFMTKTGQFFSEFIASTILMFVIFALKDDSNPGAMGKSGAGKLFPLALFFLIFGLGSCFGWETGYAINLARDFGPRLMSYILGYGHEVWSAGGYYFWIPMIAPFLGTVFGGFFYDVFIYTGPESPVNTPWLGFKHLLRGGYWRRKRRQEKYDV